MTTEAQPPRREVVYSSESRIKHPFDLLREMFTSVWGSRELAWRLTVRDISAQYRQSLLGYFWAFIPPIAATLIFIMLSNNGVFTPGDTGIAYGAFVMIGTVLWQTFVEAVNAPLKVVMAAKSTLAKINFPYEALILSAIAQVLFSFAIKMVVVAGVFIWFDLDLSWGVPVSLGAVLLLLLLGVTIGTMITPFALLFSDFMMGIMILLNLWFFVTPVVYPTPDSFPFSLVSTINPVSPFLVGARDLATTATLNDAGLFFAFAGIMLVALFVIWVIFRLSIPILIERMSA